MPDPAGTFTDGSLVFGSQILTIADTAGVDTTYIAEDFSLDRDANWLVSKNEVNVPNKQAAQKEVATGSATLQLGSSVTKEPKLFATFQAVTVGGAVVNLIVAKVGQKFGQGDEAKVTIDLREKLN